jgi:hypothetical protein
VGTGCLGGKCALCGGAGQACCPGSQCTANLACDPSQHCVALEWTQWISRDTPNFNGDGEHLSLMITERRGVCPNPVAIQCRRISDMKDAAQTGEVISFCDPARGLECLNASQADGLCDDYEVRFQCPQGTIVPAI